MTASEPIGEGEPRSGDVRASTKAMPMPDEAIEDLKALLVAATDESAPRISRVAATTEVLALAPSLLSKAHEAEGLALESYNRLAGWNEANKRAEGLAKEASNWKTMCLRDNARYLDQITVTERVERKVKRLKADVAEWRGKLASTAGKLMVADRRAETAERKAEGLKAEVEEHKRRSRELQVEHDGLRRSEREWRTKLVTAEARILQLEAENRAKDAALALVQRLIDEALPKFNWGASFLDANAIALLNEVPGAVRDAREGVAS